MLVYIIVVVDGGMFVVACVGEGGGKGKKRKRGKWGKRKEMQEGNKKNFSKRKRKNNLKFQWRATGGGREGKKEKKNKRGGRMWENIAAQAKKTNIK